MEITVKEIEVKIEPHSNSLDYYCVYWRKKKRFNLFNCWSRMVSVYDGAQLTYDQPLMFSRFEDACNYGERIKKNPNLITEHYLIEDKKYKLALERRKKRSDERNKIVIF